MDLYDIALTTIDGSYATMSAVAGRAALVVNLASRCGFTPQYTALQRLHAERRSRGFTVLGFPCNQFGDQEPGTNTEIQEFCTSTYGVTFPMFAKVEVVGPDQHPLFALLSQAPDAVGEAGPVRWNFEKFLLDPTGRVVERWRSDVDPLDPRLVAAVDAAVPIP